jgi:hypothetical protein
MNNWTKLSVDLAQKEDYLDKLYEIYPIMPNPRREITAEQKEKIKAAFSRKNNAELITELLNLDIFPIKDSYVAYLKKDSSAIARNPKTIDRIASRLFQMGLEEIIDKCTEPKETNRQMGPMFKRWIEKGLLGVPVVNNGEDFLKYTTNCIFNGSDWEMKNFAKEYLGFNRDKGLDFIAKFNDKYIIAEAKFLTDMGGHQNAQFGDAIRTMQSLSEDKKVKNDVLSIAIMDGVLFIKGNNKLYNYLQNNPDKIIISALLLKKFLYSI